MMTDELRLQTIRETAQNAEEALSPKNSVHMSEQQFFFTALYRRDIKFMLDLIDRLVKKNEL